MFLKSEILSIGSLNNHLNHMKKISIGLFVLGFVFLNFSNVHATGPDTTPPVITLTGSASVSIEIGSSYTDDGATALDDTDGDITASITVLNPVDTNTLGTYTVTYNVSDIAGNSALQVERTVTVVAVPQATLLVRNGATVIFDDTVSLPASRTVSIMDDVGATHSVDARSVLGFLYTVSQDSNSGFTLSDLQYFTSFGSFYLKCLLPTGGTDACDNWQFVVGGTTPWTSMDATMLTGGEHVGIYFGTPHQVTFDTTSINPHGSFTATAETYNYLDNTWSPLTGVTIGATQPNPSDPWNPTVISTVVVDSQGKATLTLDDIGSYNVGIAEDYYYPSYVVTVVSSSGGGGGGGSTSFSVPNAIQYLTNVQQSDGSFSGLDLYSDWAALALGASNTTGAIRTKLLSYFTANNSVHSLVTDNERHAMALLALGQNPYSFNGTNFIAPILSSFDGTQFGDASLVNDDVFAIIVLQKTGYTSTDTEISQAVSFVVGKQLPNGSWENSVDMTSAAVQALARFDSLTGVSTALTNAGTYLQNNQNTDGGWGNISSSAWATGAMNALGTTWTKNSKSPSDYFATVQAIDGGTNPTSDSVENRTWATSYAIPAVLGKTWFNSMTAVARPTTSNGGGSIDTTTGTTTDTTKKTETKKTDTVKTEEEKKVAIETIPEIVQINPIVQPVVTRSALSRSSANNTPEIVVTTPLTANALGAVGAGGGNRNTIPIVLATGSGLILLFVVVRRLV